MLYLADCYEQRGLTASAWAQFRQAAALAAEKNDAREKVARRRLEALEPKLAYLTITVKDRPPGLALTKDDAPLSEGSYGVAVPVDPGTHVVIAKAAGKKTWKSEITVAANARVDIVVPVLESAPTQSPPPTPAPPKKIEAPPEDPSRGDSQRLIGIIVGGVGIVGLGVGSYFGLRAQSKLDDSNADNHCRPPNDTCDATGLSLREDASSAAAVSTVAFVVGAVGVAAGVVLYLTAETSSTPRARLTNPLRITF